ncbi:DNA polymerase III subunit delta [Maioricimonas sp. JC845]|uniref:DNA polymerase III subunit delta n=1 Tax=Maioricimonas sp. JC845 TaxID=3232138 RepID=UPI0034579319
MHATAFLKQASPEVAPVVVLHGDDRFLKQQVRDRVVGLTLETDDPQMAISRFVGKETDWKSVHDELKTVSMFSDRRVALVEEADDLVSAARAAIEKYVDAPSKRSVLILDVKTWRKNTKLAKKIATAGLELECAALTGAKLTGWLVEQAKSQYGKQLSRDAAGLMVELAGTSLGLLDQELSKLASFTGEETKIGIDEVRRLVGGWKAETTWVMIDAVREGDAGTAIRQLGRLLEAGEAAPKILGGINFVFRKLAKATERSRQGVPLRAALKDAGVFHRDIEAAERYLRRIGRPRAERMLSELIQTDSNLKGASRLPERILLEQLILNLAGRLPVGSP